MHLRTGATSAKELVQVAGPFDSMPSKKTSLYEALLACETEAELRAFIVDLLSLPEIRRAEQRWEIAQAYIASPCSKRAARRRHRASQDLIARVVAVLERPSSGYRQVSERLRRRAAARRKA